MRGGVVKLDLLMAAEPSPGGLVLVDVEVVHDNVLGRPATKPPASSSVTKGILLSSHRP